MVKRKLNIKKILKVGILILILIALGTIAFFYFSGSEKNGNFEVDRLFVRTILEQGSSAKTNINILNKENQIQEFSIKVNELNGLVSIKEKQFNLGGGGEKSIEMVIASLNNTEPGIYFGNIMVKAKGVIKNIPVTIEIQTKEVLFSSNVNLVPQGKDLVPGQKLNAEIKVFNLQKLFDGNVRLVYFIKDFSGKTIVSEEEIVVIEGSSLGISKTLDLPKNLELGDYAFAVLTKYGNSVGTSSRTFKVVKSTGGIQQELGSRTLIIIVVVFGFFFLVFLVLIIYSIFYKDKLLTELQKQYKSELRRQGELIRQGEKQTYVKLRTTGERKEYKKEVKQVKKQRIFALRKIQKKRLQEFKRIKKLRKIPALKKQMEKWRKQGYNTGVLEQKFKLPSVGSIRNKINKWKKQGYDTSALETKLKNR
tara:strand:- start:533 stop:1798 length:1266 start_codon:yes stop_codon:yes gene_type:complete